MMDILVKIDTLASTNKVWVGDTYKFNGINSVRQKQILDLTREALDMITGEIDVQIL